MNSTSITGLSGSFEIGYSDYNGFDLLGTWEIEIELIGGIKNEA